MSEVREKRAVGYILKKFPVLSETFILNELLELEKQGTAIHIFSLERPNDPRFHEDLPRLRARISYLPDELDIRTYWKHYVRASRIFGKQYGKTLTHVLKCGSPSLMWRFFQSCYVANEARRFGVFRFHSHFATRPTTVAYLSSKLTGLPYSFTAHAMDIFKTRLSTKSLARKIRASRFVVAISEYNREYLEEIAPQEAGKIMKIHNGINLERFQPNGTGKRDPFTFICVARFVEKKGHGILIEACDLLRQRNLSFECHLVGKGKMRTLIDRQIKEKKLKNYVKLLGPHSQEEVLYRYRRSHAYVLPCIVGSDGNRDGLPVSIVEALASGLPVITTPMTGNPEVVQTGRNGILVPFNDPPALADAMEKLIVQDDYYEGLRRNSRASVESLFDLKQTTDRLRHLFEEVPA